MRMKFLDPIVPAFLWLWLCWHLHDEWSLNPQYNYGWGVPFLAAFLFYLRWQDRPAPSPLRRRIWPMTVDWSLLALFLPIRVIEEANPDWRLLSWAFAVAVVSYSLGCLLRAGGRAWLGHFAFPVCFPLVAVPWPVRIENLVVQSLTRAVAFAAVEIASWLGLGAYQLGNVIELHNGFVGVDEACSGVKTLQAAIMVALLLGELLLLPAARRLGLMLVGCAWVFLCNVLRATCLVIIAAQNGTEALHRWHDTIGTAVLVVGMGGLMGIGWLLRGQAIKPVRAATVSAPSATHRWTGSLVRLVWLALIFLGTEHWYRSHEKALVALPDWEVRWPEEREVRSAPIADSTRAILRYNDARSAAWEAPAGVHWWSFFARWEPQRAALQLVRSHSPEVCLPAAGRIFRGELAPVVVQTTSLPLRFRAYQFEQGGRALFVFVCIQEDKVAPVVRTGSPDEWNARGRLLAAWRGQRNLGQRLLEIAVIGFDDIQSAHEALNASVRAIVVPSARPVPRAAS